MTVSTTALTEKEFFAWYPLFAEYAAGVGIAMTDQQVMRVWAVLQQPHAHAAVAHDPAGTIVGFVHALRFDRLLQGDGGYQLEDLYVIPEQRGRGIATRLVEHVRGHAEADRRPLLRWAAGAEDPATAALQRKFAESANGWTLQTQPVG